jgi:hypothetical protein
MFLILCGKNKYFNQEQKMKKLICAGAMVAMAVGGATAYATPGVSGGGKASVGVSGGGKTGVGVSGGGKVMDIGVSGGGKAGVSGGGKTGVGVSGGGKTGVSGGG